MRADHHHRTPLHYTMLHDTLLDGTVLHVRLLRLHRLDSAGAAAYISTQLQLFSESSCILHKAYAPPGYWESTRCT